MKHPKPDYSVADEHGNTVQGAVDTICRFAAMNVMHVDPSLSRKTSEKKPRGHASVAK